MNISLVMFCKLLLVIVLPPLAGCLLGRLAGKSLWRGAVLAAAIVLACLCTLRFLFFPSHGSELPAIKAVVSILLAEGIALQGWIARNKDPF